MSTDTKVANLIINKGLTKAELNEKYQQGLIGDNELSIVDMEENVVQVDEMPVASASNVNSIVQFSGETTEDYTNGYFYKSVPEYSDPTATISQTVGSGLTDLTVDVDTFVEAEQPSGDETVDFVASITPATLSFVPQTTWSVSATPEQLKSMYLNEASIDLDSLTPAEQQNLFVEYYNENNVGFGFSGSTYINLSVTALGNYGITITGTPVENESTTGVYTPQTVDWEKDSSAVDIASYGISFNGTPSDGDTLTVVYTATAVISYNWTQINVQPGGGGTNIEWKTIVDLPATYSSGAYLDCPQFIVQGGLPDGNYEFYYQVKTRSNSGDQTAPFGVATYKIAVRFYHVNGLPHMVGSIAPIIEGNWMPSSSYKLYNHPIYGCFYEDSGNFVIWGSDYPLISDLGDWPNTSAPGCFKLSTIKNTDTGDEYIATGIEPDGQQPYFTQQYSGSLYMDTIQTEPSIPSYFQQTTLNYGTWYMFSGNYITINETHPGCCSELDVSLVSSNGGRWHIIAENTPDSYKINLLEASGDLANVQVGYDNSKRVFLYINTPSGTVGTVNTFVGIKGAAQISAYFSDIGQPANFTQFTLNTVGGNISTSNYGSILQYTGVTDSNYTNGYFYKANGTPTTTPASMLCNETSGLGLTITCNDIEGFITALASNIGWNRADVQSVFRNQVTVWQYTQDSNTLNWNWYGNVNPSLISYFDIVGPEVPASTTIQWTVSNYVAEGVVITNPHWDRVDVQPAADLLPSQTGNAGKFLTTDGTAASWSDKPLVNKDTSSGGTGIGIGGSAADLTESVRIGVGATASSSSCTVVGYYATAKYLGTALGNRSQAAAWGVAIGNSAVNSDYTSSVAIGNLALSSGDRAIAIGGSAQATAANSVMINASGDTAANNVAGSIMFSNRYNNAQHTYELVSADGTIPEARLADTTNASQGQVLSLDSNLNAVWTTPSGGGSVPTLTWYTVSTAGNTLTIADTSSAQLVKIYKNGLLLEPTADYSISGTTLTMVTALVVGDKITTEVF